MCEERAIETSNTCRSNPRNPIPRLRLFSSMDVQSIAPASTSPKEELVEVVIEESGVVGSGSSSGSGEECGICAICLEKILLHETALIKGCEHAYCVTCILRWATYKEKPSCPQCKNPFEFLNLHRSLDGCIHDFMFEESVCLLLRAAWFVPLKVEKKEDTADDIHDMQYYQYADDIDYAYDDDDDLEEAYFVRDVPNICIGNRRWGNNGFVRAGRKEARPVKRKEHQIPHFVDGSAGPSRPRNEISKDQEKPKDTTGRRAKRALKREAADKAAAAKHQLHLERLGLK